MKRKIYLPLFILGTVAMTGCSIIPESISEHPNVVVEAVEEANYSLAEVERGDVLLTQKLFFVYSQTQEEKLSFSTEGRKVTSIYAKVGDEVEKGQLLAQLYCEDLVAELESYKYQKKREELLCAQAKELFEYDKEKLKEAYDSGTIPKKDYKAQLAQLQDTYDHTKNGYDDSLTIAKLRIAELEAEIEGCKVYAGIHGVVSFMLPRMEDSVSDKDVTVYRLINSDECLFRLEDSEYSSYFEVGQNVHLRISDEVGYDTTVKEIRQKASDDSEEAEQVVYLEPEELDMELAVGTRCYDSLVLDSRENVLYLPNSCVFLADGQAYVFVEDASGMKSIQNISIGMKGDYYTEITGGLEEGDIVIRK